MEDVKVGNKSRGEGYNRTRVILVIDLILVLLLKRQRESW